MASCVFRSFSRRNAFFTLSAFSKAAREVVAPSLNRRPDLGRQIGDLRLILGLFLLEQGLVRLHHGDALVHPRNLIVHVADVLLQDQLRIFSYRDEESDERADSSG